LPSKAVWSSYPYHFPDTGDRPEVLVELLEEENEFLFGTGGEEPDDDVIVSPRLVSHVLSQIALRPELGGVYAELSRAYGSQISLLPVPEALIGMEETIGFEEIEARAVAAVAILLGLRRRDGVLLLNPDRDARWRLREGDELVVLSSFTPPKDAQETPLQSNSAGTHNSPRNVGWTHGPHV
jgi:hypothetical protein